MHRSDETRVRGRWLTVAVIGLIALATGCSGGGSPGAGASAAPGTSVEPGASIEPGPSASTGGGGGGALGDPCALLRPGEIAAELLTPMKDGASNNVSDLSAGCTWAAVDEANGASVSLTLERFEQDAWDTYVKLGPPDDPTVNVPGIGDETIRVGGIILGGTYAVRVGDRDATFLVVSFTLDDEAREEASKTFADLIAGRM